MRGYIVLGILLLATVWTLTAGGETIVVDDDNGKWRDYDDIQEAVDEAKAGDVIHVFNGSYLGPVRIDKSLTLMGNGSNCTEIARGYGQPVVKAVTSHVVVTGFSITARADAEGKNGVESFGSDLTVTNCSIFDSYMGIYVYHDSEKSVDEIYNTTIIGNNITSCESKGISLRDTYQSVIVNNSITNNGYKGITSNDGYYNIYSRNNISGNYKDDIFLYRDYGSVVANNTLPEAGGGISLRRSSLIDVHDNEFIGSNYQGSGVSLYDGSNGVDIIGNRFINISYGIILSNMSSVDIESNNFSNCRNGVWMSWGSRYCKIKFNDFIKCLDYALRLNPTWGEATECNMTRNVFIDNNLQGDHQVDCTGEENGFDDGWIGNYWSDHTGTDVNGDGVLDQSFGVEGQWTDRYPLTSIDVARSDIDLAPRVYRMNIDPVSVYHGEKVDISGIGLDREGDIERYIWTSDRDGEIHNSTTSEFSTTKLSRGHHAISLQVMDGAGQVSVPKNKTVFVRNLEDALIVDDSPGPWCDVNDIQTAIDSASRGMTIRIYEGDYSGHIVVDKEIHIIGNGTDLTRLTLTDGQSFEMYLNHSYYAPNPVNVSDFSVIGAGTEETGMQVAGAVGYQFTRVHISNVLNGLWIIDSRDTWINDTAVSNITEKGVVIEDCHESSLNNVKVRDSKFGLTLLDSNENSISDCTVLRSKATSISVDNSNDNEIISNHVEDAGSYCVKLFNGSEDNLMDGNTFIREDWATSICYDQLGENDWYMGYEGNYWSDYEGPIAGNIGRNAYKINGYTPSEDRYPLASPNATRTVAVLTVDDDWAGATHGSIQDAIDSCLPGDLVKVHDGTYNESLDIRFGIKIIGNGSERTVLTGFPSMNKVIAINASNCNISSIGIAGDYDVTGIYTRYDNNTVFDCEISNMKVGINISYGDEAKIYSTMITGMSETAISLYQSDKSIVDGCSLIDNKWGISIYDRYVSENLRYGLSGGDTYLTQYGSGSAIHHIIGNLIEDNSFGIHMDWSRANVIENNSIKSNGAGIYAYGSDSNRIEWNLFIDNREYGLSLEGWKDSEVYQRYVSIGGGGWTPSGTFQLEDDSSYNSITNNTFSKNPIIAIKFSSICENNKIHHNKFIENGPGPQVRDDGASNEWDDGYVGNEWSHYEGYDKDGDGIGESTVKIDGSGRGEDRFPVTDRVEPAKEDMSFELMGRTFSALEIALAVIGGIIFLILIIVMARKVAGRPRGNGRRGPAPPPSWDQDYGYQQMQEPVSYSPPKRERSRPAKKQKSAPAQQGKACPKCGNGMKHQGNTGEWYCKKCVEFFN